MLDILWAGAEFKQNKMKGLFSRLSKIETRLSDRDILQPMADVKPQTKSQW